MAALATVDQVAARIGEPIDEPDDVELALATLEEASNLVRFYAQQPLWTAVTAPAVAVTIAVAAAARGFLNPSGFDMERGDMATLKRPSEYTSGCALTAAEITIVKALGHRGNVRALKVHNSDQPVARSHWRPRDRGYAPLDWGDNKPFPLGYW
jgi:stage V sporulation protein SpoVS